MKQNQIHNLLFNITKSSQSLFNITKNTPLIDHSWPRLTSGLTSYSTEPVQNKGDYNVFTIMLLSILLLFSGCATTPDEELDVSKTWPVDKLYNEAKKELKDGDYQLAIEYFETLQARFPFGQYAQQAQLEAAYAYYLYEEQDSAIAAANRFIRLHPKHPKVDYAYYLRGLASFHKKDTPLDSLAPQDPAERDPSSARESFDYFSKLVTEFPKSKYVPDAIKRMKYQRNTLANHELNVANYYMKRGAYVAAANRAKYIIENYPRTTAIPNALTLMALAYKQLDINDLSADTQQVIDANYPNQKDNSALPTPTVVDE